MTMIASSKEYKKIWLVVAFHFGSICHVLSFTPLRGHSNIFEYDNLNREKIEKNAGNYNSAVNDCCVPPKFSMIFSSAVLVRLQPILSARVPPQTTNSSPAFPASVTRI
jgi:hypothetical protein